MVQSTKSFGQLQQQLDSERRLVSFDSYDMTIRQIYEMFIEGAISAVSYTHLTLPTKA